MRFRTVLFMGVALVGAIGWAQQDVEGADFQRGECNQTGQTDLADVMHLLDILFVNVQEPLCADACDANDDGSLDISDAIYLVTWLLVDEGTPPPAPFPGCGIDPTEDEADCVVFAGHCP